MISHKQFSSYHGLKWNLRKWIKHKSKDWILGRYACLGSEVMNRLYPQTPVFNVQKGRVDLQNKIMNGTLAPPIPDIIEPHLMRPDLLELAIQQSSLPAPQVIRPRFLLMDSFSELTDQLFVHRTDGWQFCYNWTDLNHTTERESLFKAKGLLPIHDLECAYREYFTRIQTLFPGMPMIYLFFSTALDSREKFKERDKKIAETINRLKADFPELLTIALPDHMISRPKTDNEEYNDFPYHYSSESYDQYAERTRLKLKEVLQ
jgi:hypothetical protein